MTNVSAVSAAPQGDTAEPKPAEGYLDRTLTGMKGKRVEDQPNFMTPRKREKRPGRDAEVERMLDLD